MLLQLIAAGDQAAMGMFYDRTSRLIFSLVLRILGNVNDAEEITQDVFLTAWKKATSFDSAKGSALAWITAIARNRAIDRLRSKPQREKRREVPFDESGLGALDDTTAASDSNPHVSEQAVESLGVALDGLPRAERELIELAYFEGLTHMKIAARQDLPLGTVKTRLRRAVIRMREITRNRDQ